MASAKKQDSSSKKPAKKRTLRPSSSKNTKPAKAKASAPAAGKKLNEKVTSKTTSKAGASVSSALSDISLKKQETRALSDEESEDDNGSEVQEEEEEEQGAESDPEDYDRQLGLQRTLRVVSKATVRRTWKPIDVKTRTHVQTVISNLFPAAISRARGEKRKIAVQVTLNRLMQKMNDRLSELDVPPPRRDRINYHQLMNRNKELEAMLVPDLEHIRDLELRLEQEKLLAEQDEEELKDFQEKKRALDSWTNHLHRFKLHPQLRDNSLSSTMAALCAADNNFSHLSVADQRLMSMMPTLRDEVFSASDTRDMLYNPDKDLKINKISKRLGSRLSSIEQNTEGLDPLVQLVAAAQERVRELSNIATSSSNAR
ncbi:hypothetical protein BC939DRAFT_461129 [Gamsiella multidivaricata]|uniref:uncharacterized protein n=1 Tax=Gamsiella multidivaricata TaxID=101098 RepID=UPI00221E9FEE|nr:uncharacterized protein BC939DRAFT_461129 [Gamsiella multidivaricata]KAI7819089.1 hypothetical protein BC939DRAFT_461129 [Gamsiella multidivaricata]